MGSIPDHYKVDLDIVGPVELQGIPTAYQIDIRSLPKIQIGLDPITINPLTINPLDLSVRVKEIPSVRTHIPANFNVGVSVLGLELFSIQLCGEAQVITEPYVRNLCEYCSGGEIPIPLTNPIPVKRAGTSGRKRKSG